MRQIKQTIIKYKENIPSNIYPREQEVYETKLQKANIIIGPRKAGKSYFLYEEVKKTENPIIINFEDNKLIGVGEEEFHNISTYAKELYGNKKFSFFLDEIQEIKNWEKLVISLLNEGCEVFITGSNSRLLSKEIATNLRGKSLSYLLLPLSFKEYLLFKQIKIKPNYEYSNQAYEIKTLFESFFREGGFPELALTQEQEIKNKLINEYYNTMIYKDIEDRLNIRNSKLLQITMNFLLNCFANTFSITKFQKYLKSNAIPYSLEQIYEIIKIAQDSFFCQLVKEYKKSYKKTEISKTKVYLLDTGYTKYIAREPNDVGRILENLVFIELFRRNNEIENKNIFFHQEKHECDFIIKEKEKIINAIQVCYELTEDNKEREFGGLREAMNKHKLKNGLILTYNQEDKIIENNKTIHILPVWRWLLQE